MVIFALQTNKIPDDYIEKLGEVSRVFPNSRHKNF